MASDSTLRAVRLPVPVSGGGTISPPSMRLAVPLPRIRRLADAHGLATAHDGSTLTKRIVRTTLEEVQPGKGSPGKRTEGSPPALGDHLRHRAWAEPVNPQEGSIAVTDVLNTHAFIACAALETAYLSPPARSST